MKRKQTRSKLTSEERRQRQINRTLVHEITRLYDEALAERDRQIAEKGPLPDDGEASRQPEAAP